MVLSACILFCIFSGFLFLAGYSFGRMVEAGTSTLVEYQECTFCGERKRKGVYR